MNTLIAKYLRGQLNSTEGTELEDWLSESSANQRKLEEFRLIWQESGQLRKGYKPETEIAWQQILKEISGEKSIKRYRWISGVAATLILVSFLTFLYMKNDTTNFVAQEDVQTPIELTDGSIVWINKDSKLSFENGETSRNIVLRGEAFFDVKPNPDKPFIIKTGALTTRVVGTSFNVNAHSGQDIEVVVTSGRVVVFNEDDSIYLDPGEKGSFDKYSRLLTESNNISLNFDSWRTGILVFEDSPMEQVILVLEKHFNTELSRSDTIEARLNGTFDNQTLDEILEVIALSTDVQIIVKER